MVVLATIYAITHESRPLDVYVGQTIDTAKRWRQHRAHAKKLPTRLYYWWRKRCRETGVEPIMTVLAQREFATRAEAKLWLDATEIDAIARVRSGGGRSLNSTAGGDGGKEPSFLARFKMSFASRGRKLPRTPEWQAKITAALTGRKLTPEHRARVGRPGRRVSAETRSRISSRLRARERSPEHNEKLAAVLRERAAQVTHCPQGHEYSSDNTVTYRGKRHCRLCNREHARRYDEKNRARRAARKREMRAAGLWKTS